MFLSDSNGGGGGKLQPFFSIIVPVYNTEQYIARCLDSCINQTFTNIEIIVVDDCGQDNAMQIVEKYANYDKRIKPVYNHKNLGTFQTRIVGENMAKGNYIFHIDSDDYIDINACKILYSHCKNLKYDVICFGLQYIGFANHQNTNIYPKIFNNTSFLESSLKSGLSNKIFKTNTLIETNKMLIDLLGKLPKISMGEDGLKLFAFSMIAKQYFSINDILYFYAHNPLSITSYVENSGQNKQNIADINEILKNINIIFYSTKTTEEEKKIFKLITKELCKVKKNLQYIYYHSKSQEKKLFAYPINFIKSLYYVNSCRVFFKTLTRIFLYLITLGKVKI